MTDYSEEPAHSDAELEAEFARLFPLGFAGPDVMQELAPESWAHSPLVAVNHPSGVQVYEESVRVHRNIEALRRPDDTRPPALEPTLEEITREHKETPVDPEREARELVGECLWDIFSDGHDVVGEDGRRLDLGSFRASGGFIADALNRQAPTNQYDYLDFYMGTIWVAGRADLTTVYRMIFRRLKRCGLDWVYHFPRLYAVDMRPLKAALDRQDEPEWANYDPSQGFAQQEEDRKKDEKLAELRESLDQGYRESVEAAWKGPPPVCVRAYEEVYGQYPKGWPPES